MSILNTIVDAIWLADDAVMLAVALTLVAALIAVAAAMRDRAADARFERKRRLDRYQDM